MRFAILSDTHLFHDDEPIAPSIFWNRSLPEQKEEIVQHFIASIRRQNPDFVIHCGDLTHNGSEKSIAYASSVMDEIGVPWYLAVGNHDTKTEEGRALIAKRFGTPSDCNRYVVDKESVRLIFLDTGYRITKKNNILACGNMHTHSNDPIRGFLITQDQIQWLETKLEEKPERITFIVTHAPLTYKKSYFVGTMPDGTPMDPKGTSPQVFVEDTGIGVRGADQVVRLLNRYLQVKAVFSGHWHIHDFYKPEQIAFCQTCSMREYPFEFKMAECKEQVLHVSSLPLADERFAAASYVEKRGNRFVKGKQADRSFVLQLS